MANNLTRTVAFRLNEREYQALTAAAESKGLKLGRYVRNLMTVPIAVALDEIATQERKAAAKAKRDAKKAAAIAEVTK